LNEGKSTQGARAACAHAKRVLAEVRLKLEIARAAATVTAKLLESQCAGYDLDAARVIIRCVSDPLADQGETLEKLCASLQRADR
jgi:hypothetical protein